MRTFDLVVLGGGSAAALARRAGEAGWRTALIDPGPLGGTCPNRGCIPSKLLLQHATVAESIRGAKRFHIEARIGKIDSRKIFAGVRKEVSGTHERIHRSLGRNVTYFQARGELLDAHTVRADGRSIRGKRLVIATGTRPAQPEDCPRDCYLVSDDLFELEKAPATLIMVGGGFIGCEFAHFFAGLGTRVILVERGATLLPAEDEDIRRAFQAAFAPRIDLRLKTIAKAAHREGKFTRIELQGKGRGVVRAEVAVYGIGRVPNTDRIGIERTGIRLDARGFIRVDDRLRTNVRGVYAVGDVNGRHLFTHAATAQVEYLGDCLLEGRRGPLDHGPMPHALFTHPEIGSVGETEAELKRRGVKYLKAIVPYRDLPKGVAIKEEHGLAKMLADPRGRILGFHVVGAEASILVHQVVGVLRWRNHVSSLTGAITVHPALNEIVTETAWRLLEKLPPRARRGP